MKDVPFSKLAALAKAAGLHAQEPERARRGMYAVPYFTASARRSGPEASRPQLAIDRAWAALVADLPRTSQYAREAAREYRAEAARLIAKADAEEARANSIDDALATLDRAVT